MMAGFLFIPVILMAIVLLNSWIFWILVGHRVKPGEAFKITVVATAMNKLLLTGTGYAAMSFKAKRISLAATDLILSFIFLELFSVAPYLLTGLYFGARMTAKIPIVLIGSMLIIFLVAVYKIKKAQDFLKGAVNYLGGICPTLPLIISGAVINFILGIAYYFFLFKFYGVRLPVIEILKIISITFATGYLSPAPSGLGFKDGMLTFLLTQHNIVLSTAALIAVTDRLIGTFLYAFLGFIFGGDIILQKIRGIGRHSPKF